MKMRYKISVFLSGLLFVFCFANQALAAADCECYSDLDKLKPENFLDTSKIYTAQCLDNVPDKKCTTDFLSAADQKKAAITCFRITKGASGCADYKKQWESDYQKQLAAANVVQVGSKNTVSTAKSSVSQLIVDCGQAGILSKWNPQCKDITVFVYLLLQLVDYMFLIIGGISLGVFVYGGFMLVLSQGNPEKVQGGTGAMVNAVIGLVISFTAYVLVSYVGQVLGLQAAFSLF